MKKTLAMLLAAVMIVGLFAGCGAKAPAETQAPETEAPAVAETEAPATEAATEAPAETEAAAETEAPAVDATGKKIAFITDVGNIDDHGFNQYSYEGVTKFAEASGAEHKYYKPAGDTDQDRLDAIQQAVNDGYDAIVMAGFLFGKACYNAATANPDTLFLALDVTEFDMRSDPEVPVEVPANVALITYKEEQAGFLAGYAAVVEGYKELGFLGGIDVPAVVRFGHGFVQGAEKAAADLNIEGVNIKYWYSGSFVPTDEIATKMDAWYVEGTEVVFACGGGIFLSAQSAAETNDGLMIGVDVDQSFISPIFITSAMKALSNSVVLALNSAAENGMKWPEAYAGKVQALGAAENCIGLPMETSHFETFTQEQYDELFQAMVDGSLVVDNSIDSSKHPVTDHITVDWQ